MDLKEKLLEFYYKLFPEDLKKKLEKEKLEKLAKERKEKADLLLEYEDLLRRKKQLVEDLRWEAGKLEEFSNIIYKSINLNPFERRLRKETSKRIIESFNANSLSDYKEIKQKAVEWENTNFRIFTIRQKLRLFGIERGAMEREYGENSY